MSDNNTPPQIPGAEPLTVGRITFSSPLGKGTVSVGERITLTGGNFPLSENVLNRNLVWIDANDVMNVDGDITPDEIGEAIELLLDMRGRFNNA